MGDATLIGAVIFLATVLGKITEAVVLRFIDGKKEDDKKESSPELVKLVEWHDVRDQDGGFVWYFPRNALWVRLDELDEKLKAIREHQLKCGCGEKK